MAWGFSDMRSSEIVPPEAALRAQSTPVNTVIRHGRVEKYFRDFLLLYYCIVCVCHRGFDARITYSPNVRQFRQDANMRWQSPYNVLCNTSKMTKPKRFIRCLMV